MLTKIYTIWPYCQWESAAGVREPQWFSCAIPPLRPRKITRRELDRENSSTIPALRQKKEKEV